MTSYRHREKDNVVRITVLAMQGTQVRDLWEFKCIHPDPVNAY